MDERILVGLDVGTTKIGVVIAKLQESGSVKIIGIGTHPSEGLKKGVVTNIDKTVKSIENAIKEAESMAGVDVNDVYVGIAGKHIRCFDSKGMVSISRQNTEISVGDVYRVIEQARTVNIPSDRQIIHVIPKDFSVDSQSGIKDPLGMSGVKLEASVYIVTASVASEQNIHKSVMKAGFNVAGVVLEALASAYAVLDKDEKELGVAVVDMGGGTTDLVVFIENAINYAASIDFGGSIVTSDVSQGIRTPVEKAEEIKKKYGSCRNDINQEEKIPVPGVGGREAAEMSRSFLAEIIDARIKEILEMVNQELIKKKLHHKLGAGIVLTGGGSLLDGIRERAEEIFDLPVRIGKPDGSLGGIMDAINSPTHSTGVGLVLYAAEKLRDEK
jgi:cell division protein FtsA